MRYKCLDHDEMVESRICMSKDVDLSNMLFSAVHFLHTWWWVKSIQNTWFLFPEWYESISLSRSRERKIDLCHSGRIQDWTFPLNYNPTISECKIHFVEVDQHYFKSIHQVGAKWTAENSILLRSTSLDIQIIDLIILLWSKTL